MPEDDISFDIEQVSLKLGLLKGCTSVETVIIHAQLCTYTVICYFMVAVDVKYDVIFLFEEKDLKLSRYHRQLCLVHPFTILSTSSKNHLTGFLPFSAFSEKLFQSK